MTKTLLQVTIICAASTILSATSRAQSTPPNPSGSPTQMQSSQTWSTKHLTATGQMNDATCRASKLVGAPVDDLSGNRAGQIQDIVVNPRTGHIDFALLSLNGTAGKTNGNLVPVPWKLLRPSAAQYSVSSGQPVFTLILDRSKLKGAPTVSSTDLDQSQWRQRIYSYYGVTPPPAGGMDSEQEGTKGEGARALEGQPRELSTPPQSPPPNP